MRQTDRPTVTDTPEYVRGYRDGLRDGKSHARRSSGDGILGALLAIALLCGLGYLGWNYATTGQLLPTRIEVTPPSVRIGS